MRPPIRRTLAAALTVVAACAVTLSASPAGAAPAASARPAATGFLALGDSLAFGYQDARFHVELNHGTYSPEKFPGYNGPTGTFLQRQGKVDIRADFGCPGETTTSMINGGCPFPTSLAHVPYSGPQLTAALAWMAVHPTGYITLAIGANDALHLFEGCHFDPACVAAGLPALTTTLRTNITQILSALRGAAPHAKIAVLIPYNPFAAILPSSDPGARILRAVISGTAQPFGVGIADAFAAINQVPDERSSVCHYTLFCMHDPFGGRDIHPSNDGYFLLTTLVERALNTAPQV